MLEEKKADMFKPEQYDAFVFVGYKRAKICPYKKAILERQQYNRSLIWTRPQYTSYYLR